MSSNKHARFYLHEALCQRARSGKHNFISKIADVLQSADFEVSYDIPENAMPRREEYSLFFMREPFARNSVTLRKAYYHPFWHIERTNERWHWDVAKTHFDLAKIDEETARKFFHRWRRRLYGPLLNKIEKGGFVYLPLQGKLLEHRSFQSCSPIEMIEQTLAQNAEKDVIATLHPKEDYTPEERNKLDALMQKHAHFKVMLGGMEQLLPRCDYIVTMNSSVAMAGFFLKKPAVLFGQIDFHHIAASVDKLGVAEAFQHVQEVRPPCPQYLWWFLYQMSINAGRVDVEDQIRSRLGSFGWPVA